MVRGRGSGDPHVRRTRRPDAAHPDHDLRLEAGTGHGHRHAHGGRHGRELCAAGRVAAQTDGEMNMRILRRLGAILAGFFIVALLSVVTDALLEHAGVFPSTDHPERYTAGLYLLATGYRTLFTVLGGYVTAWLAPDRPLAH